jgi:hypothetical protein
VNAQPRSRGQMQRALQRPRHGERLGGFAVDPPTGSMADTSQTGPLVQAMAGFGDSGAGESLNTVPLSAETSQQTLLAPPQHS